MDRRRIEDKDRPAIAEFIEGHWHSKMVMSRGQRYYPHEQDGFIEWRGGKIVGLLTLRSNGESMELLTLNSTLEGQGIGQDEWAAREQTLELRFRRAVTTQQIVKAVSRRSQVLYAWLLRCHA